MVPLIIAAVVAVCFLVLWLTAQSKVSSLNTEHQEIQAELEAAKSEVATVNERLESANSQAKSLETKRLALEDDLDATRAKFDEASHTVRKRTELADAQALQIDALSGERDELRQQLQANEERIVTLAARPGVVVGAVAAAEHATGPETQVVDDNTQMLWDLEVARSERLWRNSVATDPTSETSPFTGTDDPVRQAVEIEAAALREDVGALIMVDWQAPSIESPARRLVVVRLAQEMLATASRAPGAARLVVIPASPDDPNGELEMKFVADDDSGDIINLIPPQVSSDLVDLRNGTDLVLTVKAHGGGNAGTNANGGSGQVSDDQATMAAVDQVVSAVAAAESESGASTD